MNEYIPFDFGSWRQLNGLDCPQHGQQDGGPVFRIQQYKGGTEVSRRYCGFCLLAALDKVCTHD